MDTPNSLAADMLKAAAAAPAAAAAVVKKGANNVKKDAADNVRQSAPKHARLAAAAISYDNPEVTPYRVSAEIGYDKDKPQGSLGNLLEYGSRNNPAHRDLGRALDKEAPGFEKFLTDIAGKLL